MQDPAGELVSCAKRDGGDQVGGGLRVTPSSLCRFAEALAAMNGPGLPRASCSVIGVRTKPGRMPSTRTSTQSAGGAFCFIVGRTLRARGILLGGGPGSAICRDETG